MTPTALQISQQLIRFDTVNPPGHEHLCARYLGGLLQEAGFEIRYIPFQGEDSRLNLIAHKGGHNAKLPIGFSGHTDVVPLGLAEWSVAPFAAEVSGGKLYGRGSSDMKSGVAAFVAAALELAPHLDGTAGVSFVITASEENGCRGAKEMAANGALPKVGALIIAEPTANAVLAGHKGVMRLEGHATGITAHGSMPEKGVNAVYKAARAVLALEALDFSADSHPVLGKPTLSVGWINGGLNVNSVPDQARFGLDVRTVPGIESSELVERFKTAVRGDATFESLDEFRGIWSDPADPWIVQMAEIVSGITGETKPVSGATYFTDGGPLKPAMGNPPTLILGPGEPEQAHQTDEYCRIDRIEQARAIYVEAIRRWCGV